MTRLSKQVVLVTGAASGIGAACAVRFAAEGAVVIGADLQAFEGQTAWESTEGAMALRTDVADDASVESTIAAILKHHGRLDAVVHAAGVAGPGALPDLEAAAVQRVLDINLGGSVNVARHALRPMLAAGRGSIVLLSSVLGLHAQGGNVAYNMAKGGVVMLARSLAVDHGVRGVRVNALCPGLIETPMTAPIAQFPPVSQQMRDWHALGRFGRPEEVAAAALFLASDESSFVTGHCLMVDGGWTAGQRVILGQA